jgi:NADH-quinone oxidoreductase subunit L
VRADLHLYWIPLLPLLGAAINLIVGKRLPRWLVSAVACTSVGLACAYTLWLVIGPFYDAWAAARTSGARLAPFVDTVTTWIQAGRLKIDLSFLLDPLAAVMICVVTFVGFLIHVYSIGYMAHDKRLATYFGYLNLFTGAMLILVLGDSLPVLFIGWEGVGVCSYLLIGFWFTEDKNANAGKKAFIVNRIGDFAFLLGMFLLFSGTSTLNIQELGAAGSTLSKVPQGGMGMSLAFWAALLLFGGAIGKSAQIPLYVWLPDAMAGPTPVSALIHAATMVTAGVYMVARMSFLYVLAPQAMMIVAGVGAATALFAAIIGFAQNDIKKVLAYSTVSQLGFMFVGVGVGAFTAGIFHLFTHAFFKAGLFLAAGSVMHAMGDKTDIMEMGGLRKKTPITHAVFLVYCLAIAGIPPLAGFFSKDDILLGAYAAELGGWPEWYGKLLWGVLSAAALGTAFYMFRLYFLVFHGKSRADAVTQAHIHESPPAMTIPLVVLAIGAALLGFLGLPEFLGSSFVAQWLGFPEAEHPTGLVLGLMGGATALAIVGIVAAWAIYKDGPERAARIGDALGPLVRLVQNKFYVDELYDLVIVRPFKWLARALFFAIDRIIIDKILVEGPAKVVAVVGRAVRAYQNGDLQRYLLLMVIGLGTVFYFATCNATPEIVIEPGAGNTVTFHAMLKDGVARRQVKLEWDLDGDGKTDAVAPDVSKTYDTPGEKKIVLTVTDDFGKVRKIARTVDVGGQRP